MKKLDSMKNTEKYGSASCETSSVLAICLGFGVRELETRVIL
jgi:hypothetical protein